MAPEDVPVAVCVRVRPISDAEAKFERSCIRVTDGRTIAIGNDRQFSFDRVFSPQSSSEDVFQGIGRGLMEFFLEGYNATVFAYGQTGAGKTFTMSHVTQRCVDYLEERVNQGSLPVQQLCLSVMEVYNEQVVDLLDPAHPRLTIREDTVGEVFVSGLRVATVTAVSDLTAFIALATSSRSTAATGLNATSSRSHCIVAISLTQSTSSGGSVTSKLTLVDLAGSERMKKAHSSGKDAASTNERMREGIHINSGLLALGNVIHALCDKKPHVPFRSSKLTRILQSSLAGNSRTAMIACVSSGDGCLDESLNTLKYADRARQLRLVVSRNVEFSAESDTALLISRLNAEIHLLRQTLASHGVSLPTALSQLDSPTGSSICTRDVQSRLITMEEELIREKRFARTLEEDLYRAEFTAMQEVERRREAERQLAAVLEDRNERLPNSQQRLSSSTADSAKGEVEIAKATEELQELEDAIAAKEELIAALERDRVSSQRAVEEYQQRLNTVLQDKVRLEHELERAEQRLEQTQMDRARREQQRTQLRASFEAKTRAAEVAAAEYKRRVRDAEAALRASNADRERAERLQRELDTQREAFQRRKEQISLEQGRLERLVNEQQSEIGALSRRLKEAELNRTVQQAPKAHASPSKTVRGAKDKPVVERVHEDSIAVAVAALTALDAEIAAAETEREVLRTDLELAQQSSCTARWRRSMKGFQLRLEQLEISLRDPTQSTGVRKTLQQERRSLQEKMMQLEELRPACDDAVEQLREVEERIDSLQVARNYKLKIVRSLQRQCDAAPRDLASATVPIAEHQESIAGLTDTIRSQQHLIEELNQRLSDQALLLQQLLPISKETSQRNLSRGLHEV